MSSDRNIDGVLIQWGERLFYPSNRIVKSNMPRLRTPQQRAAMIRTRIEDTVRRAPQVMVKVTGGGRGMAAIAAHFRYISQNGRLDIEDDRGAIERGKDALHGIERQWQFGGAYIGQEGQRREAFNIMLSMPRGTAAVTLQKAAPEFAKIEFPDHRYMMVLHTHQANPHVHLSVKAESKRGKRLNPRKADLHRWRETFAEQLRERGVEAEATRQATRGEIRSRTNLWQINAKREGRLHTSQPQNRAGKAAMGNRKDALNAWIQIARALEGSNVGADRELAKQIVGFLRSTPVMQLAKPSPQQAQRPGIEQDRNSRQRQLPIVERSRPGPDWER